MHALIEVDAMASHNLQHNSTPNSSNLMMSFSYRKSIDLMRRTSPQAKKKRLTNK